MGARQCVVHLPEAGGQSSDLEVLSNVQRNWLLGFSVFEISGLELHYRFVFLNFFFIGETKYVILQ